MSNQNIIKDLFNNPEDSYVIHYAFIEADGKINHLRKVISIHARNLNSSDSREFSIEKEASKHKEILIEEIDDWFDDLELSILDDFNSFLKEKSNCRFIYFEEGHGLILDELKRIFESRNKFDTKKIFKDIPPSNRKSINYLFNYIEQEKSLKNFIKKYNDDKLPANFLTTQEESVCFEKKNHNKVRESILCKIDFIINLLSHEKNRKKGKNKEGIADSINIEDLKPRDIFKNMSNKSWWWFIGVIVVVLSGVFTAGMWYNKRLNLNEIDKFNNSINNLNNSIDSINTSHQKLFDIKDSVNDAKAGRILDLEDSVKQLNINIQELQGISIGINKGDVNYNN